MSQYDKGQCSVAVAVVAVAIIFSTRILAGDDELKKAEGWYARPASLDKETAQLLEDCGANTVAYRFRVPPDTKLIVVVLAKDEKGQPIDDLSGVYTRTPDSNGVPLETKFQLTHIDPSCLVENYRGKVRWVTHIGGATSETWQPNRYRSTGSYDGWWEGLGVESPQVGKDYFLWQVKAYPKDLRRLLPDSPGTFSIQVRFRYERMTADDIYGDLGGRGNDAEEYARDVADPRNKSRR